MTLYKGTITKTFNITPKSLAVIEATVADKIYDGTTAATITGASLDEVYESDIGNIFLENFTGNFASANAGADISVSSNITLAGTAANNYSLVQPTDLKANISPKSLAEDAIQTISPQMYTGSDITPTIVVKDGNNILISNTDYTLLFSDNKNVGTASVSVTGQGNYSGIATANFEISEIPPYIVIDSRDGKMYKTVVIGTQIWMAENLNYNASGSVCYNNLESNCDTYGRLYTWATTMNGAAASAANPSGVRGICPEDWHLPSEAEWTILVNYAGGISTAGTNLKATSNWNNSYNGMDDYGFSGLPGGFRTGSRFSSIGERGNWWSTTESNSSRVRAIYMEWSSNITWFNDSKIELFSVRCLHNHLLSSSSSSATSSSSSVVQSSSSQPSSSSSIMPSSSSVPSSSSIDHPFNGTLIKALTVADNDNLAAWSIQNNLQIDDVIYGDRVFTFIDVPSELRGLEWIKPACNSKSYTPDVAHFTAGEDISVFVGIDTRVIERAAEDLFIKDDGWVLTKYTMKASNDNVVYNIYRKEAVKGSTVTLGPNIITNSVMYTVLAALKGTVPETPDISPIRLPQIATANQASQIHNGINLQTTNNAVVEIYSLNGNVISRQNFSGGVYSISLKHLPKGLYIVKVSFNREHPLIGGIGVQTMEKQTLRVVVK